MAHSTNVEINGVLTEVTEFDSTAQAIDEAAAGFPAVKKATDTLAQEMPQKAPLESPAFTGTPTLNGAPFGTGGGGVGRNLLDNWYFANPVDQRGGYVVPPGVNYYAAGGYPNSAGVTDAYFTVVRGGADADGQWYTFVKDGVTYYVLEQYVVRGYTGEGYTIDRWFKTGKGDGMTICDNSVSIDNTFGVDPVYFVQKAELPFLEELAGKTVTLSALYKSNSSGNHLYTGYNDENSVWNEIAGAELNGDNEVHLASITYTVPSVVATAFERACFMVEIGAKLEVFAAKLDLGSVQTLAHQENGKWVLNEIPDYGEELAKCQRYYQKYETPMYLYKCNDGDTYLRATYILPVEMRAVPTAEFTPNGATSIDYYATKNSIHFYTAAPTGSPNITSLILDANL